jgi:hypothetical protein
LLGGCKRFPASCEVYSNKSTVRSYANKDEDKKSGRQQKICGCAKADDGIFYDVAASDYRIAFIIIP